MNRAALPIQIDRSSPVPLYFQVAQRLEHMIESGELPAGMRLDNEIDLAGQLGLSRPTMRRAIAYLADRGLVIRKRGLGTQIAHPEVRRQIGLTSLFDDLARTSRSPHTKVLSFTVQPAPGALAAELGIAEGTGTYAFERLRYAEGEPLALMRNHVPAGLLRLSAGELEDHGLYELLRAAGINLKIARQSIAARAAATAEARVLGEPRRAPLLEMTRLAYDDQGRAVEHGNHIYRASRYSFDITLTSW